MRSITVFAAALALATALAAPLGAQEEPPADAPADAPAPVAPVMDVEEYARRLVEAAKAYAASGEWSKAFGYLRYVRKDLAATAYVQDNAQEIEAAFRAADDALAAQVFDAAKKAMPKGPQRAKNQLDRLRRDHGGSRFVEDNRAEIEALEARVRTALWTGASAFRGAATLPREGVLRLVYGFDRVEELGDFDTSGSKAGPKVAGGALEGARADGVVRHRLAIPAGASFTAEVVARGSGKLALALEGEGPALASEGLLVDVEASSRALEVAIRRGDATKPLAACQDARPQGATSSTPWRLRVERREGRLRAASVHDDGSEVAVEVEAAGALAPGLAFLSGKVAVDELAIEGPLPAAGELAASGAPGAPGARPPLPKKVWIPLAKGGLAAFKQQPRGAWSLEGETLRQEANQGSIVPTDLVGRDLDRYTFMVDLLVEKEEGRARRRDPYLGIALPVGEKQLGWIFTNFETYLDGAEDARHQAIVEPGAWTTLTVKVGESGLEAFIGKRRIFAVPLAKVHQARPQYARLDGLGFIALPGARRVELRSPRIRIE